MVLNISRNPIASNTIKLISRYKTWLKMYVNNRSNKLRLSKNLPVYKHVKWLLRVSVDYSQPSFYAGDVLKLFSKRFHRPVKWSFPKSTGRWEIINFLVSLLGILKLRYCKIEFMIWFPLHTRWFQQKKIKIKCIF